MQKSWASSHALPRGPQLALALLILAPLAALLIFAPPIAQDAKYHAFADSRALFGIPSFVNVASNAGFLWAGGLGLRLCLTQRVEGARYAWSAFFAGTVLVTVGSGYYHWSPTDATLVWDRLPMTIAFMGLLTALVSEHVGKHLERSLLGPLILAGIGSVVWWRYTGDLRLYVWVQLVPLLAILFMLIALHARYTHRTYLLYGLAAYALAKVVEVGDKEIFTLTSGAISGHSLKHLIAALGPFFVYRMLRVRAPLAPAGRPMR